MSSEIYRGEDPSDLRHNTQPKPRLEVDQDATGLNQAPLERVQNMADVAPEHQAPATAMFWTQGDHIGNDHQEAVREETGVFQPTATFERSVDMPRRSLIPPRYADQALPTFGTGLNWVASIQSPVRSDLVNFDWARASEVAHGPEVSNIELRTIYAHLIEAATRLRAEMRDRGMQVDL